jgi:hypothetical protein
MEQTYVIVDITKPEPHRVKYYSCNSRLTCIMLRVWLRIWLQLWLLRQRLRR